MTGRNAFLLVGADCGSGSGISDGMLDLGERTTLNALGLQSLAEVVAL